MYIKGSVQECITVINMTFVYQLSTSVSRNYDETNIYQDQAYFHYKIKIYKNNVLQF